MVGPKEDKKSQNPNQMTVPEHIEELRSRILWSLGVFFFGLIGLFSYTKPIMEFLRAPLFEYLPEAEQQLYFTHLYENFLTHLKVAGYTSIFMFLPFFMYQVWSYIKPGLLEREKTLIKVSFFAGFFFFILGGASAYYFVLPIAFKLLLNFGSSDVEPLITMGSYYPMTIKLLCLFGLIFEMPVIIGALGFMGIVTPAGLKRHRDKAYVGITVVSAMFAPPDAISMLLMMAPMIFLYELSILFVSAVYRKRASENVTPIQPQSNDDEDQKKAG